MGSRKDLIRASGIEFAAIYRLTDLAIVFIVLEIALELRGVALEAQYQLMGVTMYALFLIIAEYLQLYRHMQSIDLFSQLKTVALTWIFSALVLTFLGYFLKVSEQYSRFAIGTWIVITPIALAVARVAYRQLHNMMRTQGYMSRKAAIIGATDCGNRLFQEFEANPQLGIDFVGFFDDRSPQRLPQLDEGQYQSTKRAFELAREGEIDEVYIALPVHSEERIADFLNQLSDTTVTTHLVPDFFAYNLMQSRWVPIGNIPTISVFDSPFSGGSVLVKRLQDIILSAAILLLISPLLLLISIGVKLSSAGPVLFKQDRYGLYGKPIKVWKFRSMSTQDNGDEVRQATQNDPRVTAFGSFLRRTSLDELPQFFNVLAGSMSIVGPRPHAIAHNEEYRQLVHRYMLRHKVKPGITGWAQINGFRGETDTLDKMEMRVKYDLEYIQSWSLWMDVKIVVLTVFKGFVSKAAY
ncbi:undecaprenyl-phosphate glucose phosphotransferase [Alginatibacterium sediminis]|uniref:Undecaprenyl-phosphate glucose phosphotransferase n=1 Tax=Alginatibacterium sediminis TaxID=2164068 RepID=A0A420E5V4_9ALTE|nr:undecaprenyl-phosphate glucose phosphotransferase [Alginatibacterium sediminis]RKF13229.1 undecaprenyl-phosphate glucose phosphotransferase [Alginatibacterium sediminis]